MEIENFTTTAQGYVYAGAFYLALGASYLSTNSVSSFLGRQIYPFNPNFGFICLKFNDIVSKM